MRGRLRGIAGLAALGLLAAACGGGGGGGGGGGAATAPARATLPPDLPIEFCRGLGPFSNVPCSSPIETIFAQVADNAPFDSVRATTVGTADCANPREFPSSTPRTGEWWWMIRFAKGDTDYGGFMGTGGKLGVVCAPFTSQ